METRMRVLDIGGLKIRQVKYPCGTKKYFTECVCCFSTVARVRKSFLDVVCDACWMRVNLTPRQIIEFKKLR